MVKEQLTKEVLSQQLANAGMILMNMSRNILIDNNKNGEKSLIFNVESVQIHLETGVVSFITEVHHD